MPSIQYYGSKSEASIMLAFDGHNQNCTHKLRVTEHVQNKCKTDSGTCLRTEHRGLSNIEEHRGLSGTCLRTEHRGQGIVQYFILKRS